jgi:hypothetical protein
MLSLAQREFDAMNKSEIGRNLSKQFSGYVVWGIVQGWSVVGVTLSAAILFGALLSHFGVHPPGMTRASYEFIASTIILILCLAGLQKYASLRDDHLQSRIKQAWISLYKGTEWTTPAGEKGVVTGVDLDANYLQLVFEGDKVESEQRYPLRFLKPINPDGSEADFTNLNEDGSVKWRFWEKDRCSAIMGSFVFSLLMACLGVCLLSLDTPSAAYLPIAWVLIGGFVSPIILADAAAPLCRSEEDTSFPELVSKTTWKALDGRVGMVRWAERKYEGDGRYSERISLAFKGGDVEWFRRGDLKATAFEC